MQDYLKQDTEYHCRSLPANAGELLTLVPLYQEDEFEHVAGILKERLVEFCKTSGCNCLIAGFSEADTAVEHMRELPACCESGRNVLLFEGYRFSVFTGDVTGEGGKGISGCSG